jgi:hypothetical protein
MGPITPVLLIFAGTDQIGKHLRLKRIWVLKHNALLDYTVLAELICGFVDDPRHCCQRLEAAGLLLLSRHVESETGCRVYWTL